MGGQIKCPVCGDDKAYGSGIKENNFIFYGCPTCGRYELKAFGKQESFNYNHLAAYLAYHRFSDSDYSEYRYHTVLDKTKCDEYREAFKDGDITHGHPVHMDAEIVESWYPRSFSERIDKILLYIYKHTPHIGQKISMGYYETMSVLFVDRWDPDKTGRNYGSRLEKRDEDDCTFEINFMLDYLKKCSYISCYPATQSENFIDVSLMPEGYARVDQIQKNSSNGRNVLVAMKFGDDTKLLREAIRKGIDDGGYHAVFIDEVQHNDFITPELLKYIRDSKFVVVDLTHQNNGAYFEEGYAMGVGKPVIQLCKEGTQLHFDIAQKNTIIWENEAVIPERLCNRIKATID